MNSEQWIGPYEVLGEIGSGGQGAVYRARHAHSGGMAAIKVLTSKDRTDVKRFLQEAEVLRRLDHPNVLRLHEVGESNGFPFIALELIEGESLEEIVRTRGLPEPDWIERVLSGLAGALEYCHAQGVIHRDLKPANVLVEARSERPVLVDFGLVRRDSERMGVEALDDMSRISLSGELKGTPAYMPPEQADDKTYGAVGPATDVYGLGAVLYFLLCGRPPFEGKTSYTVLLKLLNEEPAPPRQHRADVDSGLESVCLRALSKDSSSRHPSPSELAAEIGALRGKSQIRIAPLVGAVALLLAVGGAAAWGLGAASSPEVPAAKPSNSPALATPGSTVSTPEPTLPDPPAPPMESRRLSGPVVRFDIGCEGRRLSQRAPCPDFTGDGVRDVLVNVGGRDTLRSSLQLVSGADGKTVWRYRGVRLWTAAHTQVGRERAIVAGGADSNNQPEAVWLDPKTGEVKRSLLLSGRKGLVPGTPLPRGDGLLFWNLAVDWKKSDPPISLVETSAEGVIQRSHTLKDFFGEDHVPETNAWTTPAVLGPRRVAVCVAREAMGLELSEQKVLWQVRKSKDLDFAGRFRRGFVIAPPGPGPHRRTLCSWKVADKKGRVGIHLVLVENGQESWRKTLWGEESRASWLGFEIAKVATPILVTQAGASLFLDPADGRVLREGKTPAVLRAALVARLGGRNFVALVTPEPRPRVILLDASLREVWSWTSPHLEPTPKRKRRDPWLAVDDIEGDGFDEIYVGLPFARRLILLSPDLH